MKERLIIDLRPIQFDPIFEAHTAHRELNRKFGGPLAVCGQQERFDRDTVLPEPKRVRNGDAKPVKRC